MDQDLQNQYPLTSATHPGVEVHGPRPHFFLGNPAPHL